MAKIAPQRKTIQEPGKSFFLMSLIFSQKDKKRSMKKISNTRVG